MVQIQWLCWLAYWLVLFHPAIWLAFLLALLHFLLLAGCLVHLTWHLDGQLVPPLAGLLLAGWLARVHWFCWLACWLVLFHPATWLAFLLALLISSCWLVV